jgi:thiol:disulfide interchange protein DsbC
MITWSHKKTLALAAGVGIAALGGTVAIGHDFGRSPDAHLMQALSKSLPKSKISSVDCGAIGVKGLCEVIVGRNVFYSTPDGRYLVVGQVLDLQRKVDLTDRRARELASVDGVEAKLAGDLPLIQTAGPAGPPNGAAPPRPAALPTHLVVDLPAANAIVRNPGAPLKMKVFTDLNCGYCHRLFDDLKNTKDIEITEYPLRYLSDDSGAKARAVLCAKDKAAAAAALYYGGAMQSGGDCAAGAKALEENMAFARSHQIEGTPMIIRADGAAHSGWMPADQLKAWLAEARG